MERRQRRTKNVAYAKKRTVNIIYAHATQIWLPHSQHNMQLKDMFSQCKFEHFEMFSKMFDRKLLWIL